MDRAPFYSESEPEQVFITAIAEEASDRAGYEPGVNFVPWARAMYDVEQGVRDALLGAYYSEQRAETYIASDRMYTSEVGVVARPDIDIREYQSLRELSGYTIGYGRGWATSEEFDAAEYLDKAPEDDNVLNVRKLARALIEMIAMNFDCFRRIREDVGVDLDGAVFLEPAVKENGLYLMLSDELPNAREIAADFNDALQAMREDGSYGAILDRFNLLDSDER